MSQLQPETHTLSLSWSKVVFPIAGLYACRMFGLFLLIPVFTLFASQLAHATPEKVGVAFGAYGLAQALMQIPFGLLSDHYGRKKMIALGLILLMMGSLIGAQAQSIEMMLLARLLQGAGAIGSVLLALLSDLTPSHDRAKAMAVIGATIGLSFSLSLILGPWLTQHDGLSAVFYFMALLAVLGLVLLVTVVPQPHHPNLTPLKASFKIAPFFDCLKNVSLQQLNLSIFIQHACLTALFYVLPLRLNTYKNLGFIDVSWHFYLPIVLLSFLIMAPIIAVAEQRQKLRPTFFSALFCLILSQLSLQLWGQQWLGFILSVFVYFVGFNLLEALLPSQVSKSAPSTHRGTAMGIYSTAQFLGIFAGGVYAGLLYPRYGEMGVYLTNLCLCLLWLGTRLSSRSIAD